MIRRAFARFKNWLFRKEPPDGGGPGGGPSSEAHTEARFRTEIGQFGGSL